MTCTLKDMIALLEEACKEEERLLRVHNVTEENLKTAFAAFQNRRAEINGIRSLSVSGSLLPAVTGLLEPGSIEEMVLISGSTDIHWPFMEQYRSLKELTIRETQTIPESIVKLQSLTFISLEWNKNLKALPQSIGSLKNLTHLDISGSRSISNLPDSIVNLGALEYVNIRGTAIQSVPASITGVKNTLTTNAAQ
ncbi:MAG: hypothetical protein FWB99_07860 [Treponema sp.]|nr:hypothetical protein [Treponema sp.]